MTPTSAAEIRQKLQADPGGLQAVARVAAGGGNFLLADWSLTQLTGGAGGNPTSDGIFRVAGHLVDPDGGSGRSWSAILKVVRSPVETGEPWDQPGDAVYWRREVEVFGSGLLDQVQGVVVPRCWGIVELANATAWLWLEDLGSLERGAWGVAEFHVAAGALARFHAPFLTGAVPIPDQPWLNRAFLPGFHEYLEPLWQRLSARVAAGDPALVELGSDRASPEVTAVLDVVADPDPLLGALAGLPMTLSHNDTHIDNLTIRPGRDGTPELVAIDWQMVGPASIGADLGQLLSEFPGSLAATARAGLEADVLRTYHNEITRAGAAIDLATVQRAYSVDALLRQALWEVLLLCLRLEDLPAADQQGSAQAIAEFAHNIATGHLPRLAAQARSAIQG